MKKQLYIFSFAIAMMTTMNAFDQLTMFDETNEESKWQVIEKAFITDINDARQSFWQHVSGGAVATLTGLGVYFTCTAETKLDKLGNELPLMATLQKTQNVYGLATFAMGTLLATQIAQCGLSKQTNRNAVAQFFGNWDKNQFFVPAELEEAFDVIAQAMELQKNQETVLANANEIVDTIQFLVMRHFEKRYEKVLQITAATTLNDTKTAGEILKNAVEATAKISGSK